MEACKQYLKELKEEIKSDAKDLREEIQQIISALDKVHKYVNISKVTGSSVSLAGTLAAIAGGILCLTGVGVVVGAPLGTVGVGVATVGAFTSAGSGLAEHFIGKDHLFKLQKKLNALQQKLEAYVGLEYELKQGYVYGLGDVLVAGKGGGKMAFGLFPAERAASKAGKVLKAGREAAGVGRAIMKGFGKNFLVLNVIFIPLDIIDIVTNAKDLKKGAGSKHAEQLRKLSDELEHLAKGDFELILPKLATTIAVTVC